MKLVVAPKPGEESGPKAETYTCPMHPEIRVDAIGKCSKCGMDLIPANPGISDDFDLVVECSPAVINPRKPLRLRFAVINPKTRAQVKQFALLHEQLFHLFIVSQDLAEFQHIHPDLQPDGSFTIETVLPHEGHYKLYSDFYPVEGAPQVLQRGIVTAGYRSDLFGSIPALNPDRVFTKTVDGTRVDLQLEPAEIIAGKPAALKYRLTDTQTGQPVRDLKPYLGAWGHTLILSEDQSDYVHSHPVELVPEPLNGKRPGGGPEITFESLFPRPGNYRVWTQFQRGEVLSTVSFDVSARMLR
jgi:hypothetical protein